MLLLLRSQSSKAKSSRMPLMPLQKQAVLDQYVLIKSKQYSIILQEFIKEKFQTHESLDNIRQLISRSLGTPSLKRKLTFNVSLEVTRATQSDCFDRTKPFSIQCQFCIEFSTVLAAAISSHELTKKAIVYHLRKLDKSDGVSQPYKKRKTSHCSSELLQKATTPASAVAAVQDGVDPVVENGTLLPPPILAAADIPKDEHMHHEADIQQDIIAQPQHGHGAIPQPTVQEVIAYSPMKQNLFPRVLITEDQMKITGYKVVCLRGRAAHRFYAGDKLYNILPQSHRVNTSLEAADQYHMFLYYSATGQQECSSRQKILGCIFVDIGYCSDVIIVTVCWLYSDPSSARGITRLGSKIVQKLFKRFPDAIFELCSKREAAPFWYKKGFVPKDAATMDKFKELCIGASREYPINVAAWLGIYGDGDQTEMICTPERRKEEEEKKRKEEEEKKKRKEEDKKNKKKEKRREPYSNCSSRTTKQLMDIMSAIEDSKCR